MAIKVLQCTIERFSLGTCFTFLIPDSFFGYSFSSHDTRIPMTIISMSLEPKLLLSFSVSLWDFHILMQHPVEVWFWFTLFLPTWVSADATFSSANVFHPFIVLSDGTSHLSVHSLR